MFWQKLICMLVPATVMLIMLAVQDNTRLPPEIVAATVRGAGAVLATVAVTSALPEASPPVENERGSAAAHCVLGGCAAVLLPVLALCLAGDRFSHSSWRWPTLSMAATSQIGIYVFTSAALPFTAATAAAVWIIEQVPPDSSVPPLILAQGKFMSSARACHKMGCNFAKVGTVCFTFSALWAETDKVGQRFHTGFSMAMFFSFWAALFLTAAGSSLQTVNGKIRAAIAGFIFFAMGIHLVLFLVVNQWVFPAHKAPHVLTIAYACAEYLLLSLIAAYPMTWIPEAIAWQQSNGLITEESIADAKNNKALYGTTK